MSRSPPWEIETLSLHARVLGVRRGQGRVRIDVAWPIAGADEVTSSPSFASLDTTLWSSGRFHDAEVSQKLTAAEPLPSR